MCSLGRSSPPKSALHFSIGQLESKHFRPQSRKLFFICRIWAHRSFGHSGTANSQSTLRPKIFAFQLSYGKRKGTFRGATFAQRTHFQAQNRLRTLLSHPSRSPTVAEIAILTSGLTKVRGLRNFCEPNNFSKIF